MPGPAKGQTIFVFGSNLLGIHGAGAALHAYHAYGAERGNGKGAQGSSYAIPTKATPKQTLPLSEIAKHVIDFKAYAAAHPDDVFTLTAIGCGLAGYSPDQIAPLFNGCPSNVMMPSEFKPFLQLAGLATADIVTHEDGSHGPSIEHQFWMVK